MVSILALSVACLMPAAMYTLDGWQHALARLRRVAEESLPILPLDLGKLCPAVWESEPIAALLEDAAACFPARPYLARVGARVREAILAVPAYYHDLPRRSRPSEVPADRLQHGDQ